MSVLGNIAGQAAGLAMSRADEQLFGDADRKNQLKQQRLLSEQQLAINEQGAANAHKRSKELVALTGIGGQIAQAEQAGLSKSVFATGLTGGGGTGGGAAANAAGAGQADSAAQTRAANAQLGMMMNQSALLGAQTEKIKAETKDLEEEAKGKGFDNVKKEIEANVQKKVQELYTHGNYDYTKLKATAILKETEAELEEFTTREQKAINEGTIANLQAEGATYNQEIREIIRNSMALQFEKQMSEIGLNNQEVKYLQEVANQGRLRIYGDDGKTINEQELKIWQENTERIVKGMLWSSGIQAGGNVVNTVVGGMLKTMPTTTTTTSTTTGPKGTTTRGVTQTTKRGD